MPRELVSDDDLREKLNRALEAKGCGDVDFGPVRERKERGRAGVNWWVKTVKNANPDCHRAAGDIVRKHEVRYDVDWAS